MLSPAPSDHHAAVRRRDILPPKQLLIAVVTLGLLASALSPRLFPLLGLPDYGHWFLDSYAILAANDAVTAGLNPNDSIPFDILKRRHVYSDWWLGLRWLGLTRTDNFLFGGFCVLAFLAVAMAGLRPRTWREAILLAAHVLAPPVLLAVNRANNDLVIFTLIGLPLLALRRTITPAKLALLGLALVLATGLKYYPVVAIAALAFLPRPVRSGLLLAALAGLGAALTLWSERAALARGAFAFPDSVYLFGSPEIWRDLGLGRGPILLLSTLLITLAATALMMHRLTTGLSEESVEDPPERWRFAVGALLLLGCFLAGTSFAYRWVFALWLVPWLWRQTQDPAASFAPRAARVLLLVSLWQDGLYCIVLNLWFHQLPPWLEVVWRYTSHSVNWLLMALLGGWLLDAAVAAWRDVRRAQPA